MPRRPRSPPARAQCIHLHRKQPPSMTMMPKSDGHGTPSAPRSPGRTGRCSCTSVTSGRAMTSNGPDLMPHAITVRAMRELRGVPSTLDDCDVWYFRVYPPSCPATPTHLVDHQSPPPPPAWRIPSSKGAHVRTYVWTFVVSVCPLEPT